MKGRKNEGEEEEERSSTKRDWLVAESERECTTGVAFFYKTKGYVGKIEKRRNRIRADCLKTLGCRRKQKTKGEQYSFSQMFSHHDRLVCKVTG